jgi:Family of unknown function (DUF5343)
MAEERQLAAVYAPWQTFVNSLNQLKNGVPSQIDRTVFPGMAGAVQSQLFAGFKFLGLMDDLGKPKERLHALATADDEKRKVLVAEMLKERYDKLFALDLKQSTLAQVLQVLADSYGVGGDTREKALRFFLAAAEFSGVELSSYILGAKRSSGPRKKRGNGTPTSRQPRITADEAVDEFEEVETAPAGTSKTISLKSGGTVTVSASLDVFSLKPDDRAFVFDLIDKLNAYEGA